MSGLLKTLRLTAPEPTEAQLQTALLRRLTLAGYVAVRINSGSHQTANGGFFRSYIVSGMPTVGKSGRGGLGASSGFPDVLALKDGHARLFELKATGGKLGESQKAFRDFAAARGVCVEIIEGLHGLSRLQL